MNRSIFDILKYISTVMFNYELKTVLYSPSHVTSINLMQRWKCLKSLLFSNQYGSSYSCYDNLSFNRYSKLTLLSTNNCRFRTIQLHRFASFQFLRVFGNPQLFYKTIDFPVHYRWQVVHGIVDSVICHSSLRIIVRSDFVGSVTATNH